MSSHGTMPAHVGMPPVVAPVCCIKSVGLVIRRWQLPIEEGWSGRLDSNQRPPHPQCDALPGCATPRLAGASRQARQARQGARGGQVVRRRRKSKAGKWVGRVLWAVLVLPALYLLSALIGSLIPANRPSDAPPEVHTILRP